MNRIGEAPRGAYTELRDLINLRFAARGLSLAPLLRVRNESAGLRQSRWRGRGIDFDEVRAYQAGDDVRTIDWRVTARTSKPHTKIFHEERERPAFIVVDQRQRMFFGSRLCCKSVQAAHLAALLAWTCLERGDQVGGMVLGENGHSEIRPKRSHHTVLHLLREIHQHNRELRLGAAPQGISMTQALLELRRAIHPGSLLFLVSDCHDLGGSIPHLHHLTRHCQLTVLQVNDPLERELPAGNRLFHFTDGERQLRLRPNRQMQNAWQERAGTAVQTLNDHLRGLRLTLVRVDTADAPLTVLREPQRIQAAS